MANGVNKVILIGNLGRDPEVRYTKGGSAVSNLRVAVSERRKGPDGEWSDHTEWVDVVVFGNTAENAGKYLSKGRQVYVEGRLQTRKWEDRDGGTRYSTEVVANSLVFLSGGDRPSGGDGARGRTNGKPADSGRDFYGSDDAPIEDDLPF